MPHASDGHGAGRGTSEAATGSAAAAGSDSGRASRAATSRNNTAGGDSRTTEGGRSEGPERSDEQPRGAGGHREQPTERVRGWRDAARRTARRLTGDQPHRTGHQADHADEGEGRRPGEGDAGRETARRPRGRPYSRSLGVDVDWQRTGVFGAGLAIGALIGASVALLTAPQSGSRTRRQIVNVGRRAGGRAVDAWGGLGDELRVARAKARRDVRRGLRGGRREVVDAWSDLDKRALEGLRSIRDWRAESGQTRGRAGRD